MRTFKFDKTKIDKKYLILVILTIILAVICGIVLNKNIKSNIYFKSYSSKYIYNVFNYKTGILLFTYLFSQVLYCYIFLFLSYCTKLKYVTLIFVFIKSLFTCVYVIALSTVNVFGGLVVILFVYVPTSLLSIASSVLVAELSRFINRHYVYFFPLILCVISAIVYIVLLNVIFRFVISIV